MARTVDQIKTSIETSLATKTSLSGLTSTSAVAIYKVWIEIVAGIIYQLEVLWDAFKADVNQDRATARIGTELWLRDQAKAFQYGDQLTIINGVATYATVDTTKQIIKYAAISTVNRVITIKVAKEDSNGDPEPISIAENASFNSYIKQIRMAGPTTQVSSTNPDLLSITGVVKFDGSLVQADFKTAFIAQVRKYLQNLEFDGEARRLALEDYMQATPGFKDAQCGYNYKTSTGTYAQYDNYQPTSGYIKADDPENWVLGYVGV